METAAPVALAPPQKRPLDDDAGPPVSTPTKAPSSNASTPLTALSSMRTPSPLNNATQETTAPASSNNSVAGDAPDATQSATASSSTQQAKRRKLTPQEKEEQQLEKEAKAKARAEKKAQKELEDRVKAEQKAQKDEEKRRKNEEKEEKKRAKELEQLQKEEEKRKKERSQMKLNAFFTKPKPTADSSPRKTIPDSIQNPSTGQIPLAPVPATANPNSAPPSPRKPIHKNSQTDYERFFLPFSLPPHAVLAPQNAFMDDPEKLAAASDRIDKLIAQEDVDMGSVTLESFKASFSRQPRGYKVVSIVEIVDRLNGSTDNPIDLTDDTGISLSQPLDLLNRIPMKYLHFPEDVRPPYYGTYTKPHTPVEERKLARNPVARGLPDLNYDYDSEAEWEEPEEGEDLDSEGEEDLEEEGDDDMAEFLDDEEDPQMKRRLISGDLVPISTGLCWEDARGVSRLNGGSGAISTEFRQFRMGFLIEPQPQSIDPFSTSYWAPEPTSTNLPLPIANNQSATNGLMNPPRLPLSQRPANGLLNTLNTSPNPPPGTASKAVKPKRQIPPEQLAAFKAEVEGQDLTKLGMIEALKKKFPKVPKDAITNTLTAVAKRVGPSEKEKRWVLLN